MTPPRRVCDPVVYWRQAGWSHLGSKGAKEMGWGQVIKQGGSDAKKKGNVGNQRGFGCDFPS